MANPTIGTIRCPFTGEAGQVKRAQKGKFPLYYVSNAGIVQPKSQAFQDYIEKHATFNESDDKPEPKPEEKPGGSWLDSLLGGDDD